MNKYMQKTKFILLVGLFLVFVFGLAGCGASADSKTIEVSNTEMTNYVHENSGMAFKVPKDWVKKTEDDQKVVFANAAGTIAFSGIFELGGYSYYTNKEQGAIAQEICKKSLTDIKVLEEKTYDTDTNSYKVVMQGLDAKGETAICEVVVYAPLDGVRYYLMALAGVDEYKQYYKIFEKSFASFYLSIDEDTLYSKIEANKSHTSAE